jgi:hypothetical protein
MRYGDRDLRAGLDGRKVGIVFDWLIAHPPEPTVRSKVRTWLDRIGRREDAEEFSPLHLWRMSPITQRSLRRFCAGTDDLVEVYTFQVDRAGEVEEYLNTWAIYPHRVLGFNDAWQLGEYLRGDLSIHTVWVPDISPIVAEIGMRARVVKDNGELN